MKNSYDKVKEWRKNTKAKLVEGFGSKCSMCGLQDDPVIYDFHHLDSLDKEFQISSKVMSWEKLVGEAKKCVLLCSHCHRKLHFRNLIVENPIEFDETLVSSQKNNRWGFK
jgi:predicted HNH restriction endonuclease